MALVQLGAPLWLGSIVVAWGAVATAFAFTTSATTFLLLRFALGVAETGAFPGTFLPLSSPPFSPPTSLFVCSGCGGACAAFAFTTSFSLAQRSSDSTVTVYMLLHFTSTSAHSWYCPLPPCRHVVPPLPLLLRQRAGPCICQGGHINCAGPGESSLAALQLIWVTLQLLFLNTTP